MKPRLVRRLAPLTLILALGPRLIAGLPAQDRCNVVEKPIPQLQDAMRAGSPRGARAQLPRPLGAQ